MLLQGGVGGEDAAVVAVIDAAAAVVVIASVAAYAVGLVFAFFAVAVGTIGNEHASV